jgi:hypothetical protein
MQEKSVGAERLLNRAALNAVPERQPAHLYTLLGWRLTGLGINPKYIERHSPDLLLLLRNRCALCADKERCLEGMMDFRHPPGWEDYCPNVGTIRALMAAPRFCCLKSAPASDHCQSA